jgi:Fe-S oxidoreductase
MGLIHAWARLAAVAPGLVNAITHAPGLSQLAKMMGGISQRRTMPRFADQTFVEWFERRPNPAPGPSLAGSGPVQTKSGRQVLLWPDTFNNHFHPDTAIAATEVLEAAGCEVVLPPRIFCCGRPLYDYGFLTEAKRLLREILDGLQPHLDAATPIVVLEPSCLAVFRDELVNLFPDDSRAKQLAAQSFLLAEFLKTIEYRPPRMLHHVLLHGHCHHKALAALEDEQELLTMAAGGVTMLDSGCCGMAGSFGFEAKHYDVSVQVGELVLVPAVRQAAADTLVVADGFSCREQIEQTTGRRAVHLAHALRAAVHGGFVNNGRPPEDALLPRRVPEVLPRELAAAAVVFGAGAALGIAAIRSIRRWRGGDRSRRGRIPRHVRDGDALAPR